MDYNKQKGNPHPQGSRQAMHPEHNVDENDKISRQHMSSDKPSEKSNGSLEKLDC